jgi:aldehyde:ferredoxin oxidoreductase
MFDWSHNDQTGIYSEHRAKSVDWQMRYDVYFKHSMGFCDWVWPLFVDKQTTDGKGLTPEIEPMLVNAVTGRNMSFADCMAAGGKILNLTRAILVLQGRNRDNEKFAEYMYTPAGSQAVGGMGQAVKVSLYKDGEWSYDWGADLYFDKDGVETLKQHYYNFEGWDTNGYPTRETLEQFDLGNVADKLESAGKLGSST